MKASYNVYFENTNVEVSCTSGKVNIRLDNEDNYLPMSIALEIYEQLQSKLVSQNIGYKKAI